MPIIIFINIQINRWIWRWT